MSDKIDYEALTLDELEAIVVEASEEIERRRLAEASKIRQKIKGILEDSGLSLNDVFKEKNPRKGRKIPMQFQNPYNPEEQWSGRGRMPVWMREIIEREGGTKEDFRIKEES